MSERRERIDRAIDELVVACLETADTPDDEPGAVARILAEQRLRAALDAEPTEAEIDAACPECGGHGRDCSFCGGTGDWPRTSEPTEAEVNAAVSAMTTHVWLHRPQEAMRAALIAARKARQGGQG